MARVNEYIKGRIQAAHHAVKGWVELRLIALGLRVFKDCEKDHSGDV